MANEIQQTRRILIEKGQLLSISNPPRWALTTLGYQRLNLQPPASAPTGTPISSTNIDEKSEPTNRTVPSLQIKSLLAELREKPPLERQKELRAQLRDLGHHGGLRTNPAQQRVWKIAPGEGASMWEECKDHGFIAIGWSKLGDLTKFKSQEEMRTALLDAYQSDGSLSTVWRFACELKVGDIVVANKGYTSALGIGRITSEYLAPTDPRNPSKHEDLINSRLVEWLVTAPIELPPYLFAQATLASLKPDKWEKIVEAYHAAFSDDLDLQSALASLNEMAPSPSRSPIPLIETMLTLASHTRNILLYGPPGTGKTYTVTRFAQALLRDQVGNKILPKKLDTSLLQSLRWYDVLALAMTLEPKPFWTTRELSQTAIVQQYVPLTNTNFVEKVVNSTLFYHENIGDRSPGKTLRQDPIIFLKTSDAKWSLSEAGQEYVHDNLDSTIQAIRKSAAAASSTEDFTSFVTFHQSFAYEEFVEALKPLTSIDDTEGGSIRYRVLPGIFRQICADAQAAWEKAGKPIDDSAPKFLLIIDEINRANIAKVLGELITLIEDDKRLGQPNQLTVTLPYSQQKFGVPPNLYILGTLNTADRSIAQLDIALRRRFAFVEMMPQYDLPELKTFLELDIPALLKTLNEKIINHLDPDHQIGHSYLLNLHSAEDLYFAFTFKILPLLQEYFYNDNERLHAVLSDAFFDTTDPPDQPPRRTLKYLDPQPLLAALRTI